MFNRIIAFIFTVLFIPVSVWAVDPVYIKKNDLQPYYYARILDPNDVAVDITNATIYVTMKNISNGTLKINRQTTGLNITDGTNAEFEYRWQLGDTSVAGQYSIEFEVNPLAGGKFTVPASKAAIVNVIDSLDTTDTIHVEGLEFAMTSGMTTE
jgi:hypothetical protein